MTRFSKLALTAVATTLLTGLVPGASAQLARPFYYFAFGDSYTEINFQVNGEQPSAKNPLGNPASGNSSFAGGSNYVGFLTRKYNSTLVYTYDFGFGGATISKSIVNNTARSFEEQVEQYFQPKYAPSSGSRFWTGDNSIFSVFFGINDIFLSIFRNPPYTGDKYVLLNQLLDKYFALCTELYQSGARRFMFVGIPPLDRSPLVNSSDVDATKRKQFNDWINIYNGGLATRAPQFLRNNSGTVGAVYDYYRFLDALLNNTAAYSFPNASCVSDDGSTCVWHDKFHVGWRLNDYLSARMVDAMNSLGFNGSTPKGGYFF